MIREISGRGLVPKKAAAAEKVKEAQRIMIKIVEAYESQIKQGEESNLLFPGSVDGIWGDLTNTSYKNILSTFNKDSPAPANIDAAIGELNKILTSLNVQALGDAAKARTALPAAASAKPASPEKADDAKAKAGFKNLLDLLQSKRLNISAGGNKDAFKQRIERDWMAIIRAYGSTDSVVETFYPHLGLTDPEKILLAAVNEKTTFGANYSSVLAKINNKFLETISKYIKPIGRAFRTERGIARVVNRRQTREERRSAKTGSVLNNLWELSKVAANVKVSGFDTRDYTSRAKSLYSLANNLSSTEFFYLSDQTDQNRANLINEYSRYFTDDNKKMNQFLAYSFLAGMIGENQQYFFVPTNQSKLTNAITKMKTTFLKEGDFVQKYWSGDKSTLWMGEESPRSNSAMHNFINILTSSISGENFYGKNQNNQGAADVNSDVKNNIKKIKDLISKSGHNPGISDIWDQKTDNAFRVAYNEYCDLKNIKRFYLTPEKKWKDVARSAGFEPNQLGSMKMLQELIQLKSQNTDTSKAVSSSIYKSIEIRKAAARKKLGL